MEEEQKGPDQILEAESFVSSSRFSCVKLRVLSGVTPDSNKPVSVPTLLQEAAAKKESHPALTVKREGKWVQWSYGQYLKEVRSVAKAFIKLGLKPRNSVGIIGFNSPEWYIADLAAVFANGIATGIYPTNSKDACKYIIKDCDANIVVVEDETQLTKFLSIKEECPELKAIVQYTGTPGHEGVLSWADLLKMGESESDEELDQRLKQISINQCCHLVYTSGTTGPPKGVMLSHDNLTYTAKMLCDTFEMKDHEERIVSYLPLSHVAANITDVFVMITCSSTVYFADNNALKGTLTNTLKEALPTLFLAVPRVWEKIHEKMMEIGRANKGLKKTIGTWAKKTGLKYNQQILEHRPPSGSLQYKIADKVVFQKVKAGLGLNKCLRFYSAAAPLSKDILEYFMSLDIRILEIYGMSECSGPQLSNTNSEQKLGTIGKTLDGFHTKIKPCENEDEQKGGEICMRGRNIMMGYLGNEAKTKEVFVGPDDGEDEGYLRSGDVGSMDENGYVTITGRIKEILITAGGENVAPVLIEDAIKKHLPVVSNVMVIGDQRKFLSCLLTAKVDVDPDTLEPGNTLAPNALGWCEEIGSKAKTIQDLQADELVKAAIQDGIDKANEEAISNAQKVRKWVLLQRDFSIPGGELGPTLKVKRHVVAKKNEAKINGIYA